MAVTKDRTFLPFSYPSIDENDILAVTQVLRSGWITTGRKNKEFEERFCAYVGSLGAVALTSATSGMHLAHMAMGIGPGDEVITPSMTWVSTVNLITLAGARVVFCRYRQGYNDGIGKNHRGENHEKDPADHSGSFRRGGRLALRYRELLADVEEILPLTDPGYEFTHAWHLLVIRLNPTRGGKMNRDRFMKKLGEKNIGTGIHFVEVHLHKYYRETMGTTRGMLPETEWNSDRICSLPLFPDMEMEDVDRVVSSIKEVLANG